MQKRYLLLLITLFFVNHISAQKSKNGDTIIIKGELVKIVIPTKNEPVNESASNIDEFAQVETSIKKDFILYS